MSKKSIKKQITRSQDGVDAVDQSKLRKNNYAEKSKECDEIYVVRNIKFENKVAEIKAKSLVHACNLIGWRPRHVILIEKR